MKGLRIAIVSAMPEELAPLRRRDARGALLCSTGDGPGRAAAGLERLLDRHEVSAILFLGIAGGLAPELEVGDVVVATEVLGAPAPDPMLLERALAIPGVVAGKIVSCERIATTAAEKARLHAATGAAAVDLESAAWARVAAARSVPFVIARAVSDTAAESLPIDFNRFMDADGHLRRWRVALEALRQPRLIPELRQLRESVRRAAERLMGFAVYFFAAPSEVPRA